jgi:ATP-dependent helicase/nuclease subunit A
MTSLRLSDQADRDRIATDLSTNLFVDASAGSGKTKAMVDRICALVDSGVSLSGIVAITFTEKAAAELRQRIRVQLSLRSTSSTLRRAALDELDSAPIGTIHSFAGRLLRENPIEAGVPPLLNISDELASQIAFSRRWERARGFLFTEDSALGAVDTLLALGVTLDQFESVARALDSAWERLDEQPDLPSFVEPDFTVLLRMVDDIVSMRSRCTKPDADKAVKSLDTAKEWATELRLITFQVLAGEALPVRALEHVLKLKFPGGERFGSKANWPEPDLADLRQQRAEILSHIEDLVSRQISTCIRLVVTLIGVSILEAARERQESGQLEFSDLLVLANRLIKNHEQVWHRVTQRYSTIMLDEFQDTDPIQAELAVRLASVNWIGAGDWNTAELRPGALFTVGDPKQSIYRFRRADIATFLAMGNKMREHVTLSTNFRSSQSVLAWINGVFDTLIYQDEDRQPAFAALQPRPDRPSWEPSAGPAVTVFGSHQSHDRAGDAREAEARDLANLIRRAAGRVSGEAAWLHEYRDKDTDEWVRRPLTLDDITILIPSRTSLPAIQQALDDADIEFIAEASSLVYSSAEVHDLLLVARAIANTADQAALVVALRSPIFGCSDAELLEWAAAGGRWSVFSRGLSVDSDSRVSRSLALLKVIVDELPTLTPAELLDRILVQRQVLEMQLDNPRRSREVWRRLRYIVDQAEAWHETTHGSLRDYLRWTEMQQEEGARVKEAVVPEKGVEAVHIMTIHAAKGLEFPMVIVAGASGHGANDSGGTVVWSEHGVPEVRFLAEAKIGSDVPVETSGYRAAYQRERAFIDAEITRLLYVACTRAETHLAVSLHEFPGRGNAAALKPSLADLLRRAEVLREGAVKFDAPQESVEFALATEHPAPVLAQTEEEWEELRRNWSTRASFPASYSITSLAKSAEGAPVANPFQSPSSLAFEPEAFRADPPARSRPGVRFVDLEEEGPEMTGDGEGIAPPEFEAGHAVGASSRSGLGARTGTAVHRTLELSDLMLTDDLPRHAQSAARAAEVADWNLVAEMASSALASDPVRRASTREHWLELPMTFATDGVVLEGVADLVYREDDGSLVIVDFKTDRTLDQETLEGYWAQLTAYANMIHGATGEPVSALRLIQCSQSPARVISALVRG